MLAIYVSAPFFSQYLFKACTYTSNFSSAYRKNSLLINSVMYYKIRLMSVTLCFRRHSFTSPESSLTEGEFSPVVRRRRNKSKPKLTDIPKLAISLEDNNGHQHTKGNIRGTHHFFYFSLSIFMLLSLYIYYTLLYYYIIYIIVIKHTFLHMLNLIVS